MPLSDIITVSITSENLGIAQAGFGTPLILSSDATFPERTRTYSSISGVAVDLSVTGPTYRAAQAIFSQNPHPETIIVGRCVNKPTQKWTIDLGSAGIQNSTRYRLQVVDALGNKQVADFTTDSSATEAELWTGLTAAFNALVGPTATAVNTGPGTSLVITGNAAGNWHAISVIDPNGQYDAGVYMSIVQDHVDPGVTADLTAISAENDSWYGVVSLFNSEPYVDAIAAYVESKKRLYVPDIQDSATVTAAVGGTDTADDLKDLAYARTAPFYHPDLSTMPAAALLGACLPLDPGSETWKFKTLAGVPVYPITSTHQTNLEAKRCNYYYAVAGRNITTQGVVSANEFVDVVRFRDWLEARISERVFQLLANSPKVPYDDRGIALIQAEVLAQLKEGVDVGGLAADPKPVCTVPKASTVSTADKTARLLRNVKFSATLAGAIHKLIITGVVSA